MRQEFYRSVIQPDGKYRAPGLIMSQSPETQKKDNNPTQPDKNLAGEQRPSQAEGDLETVEEDLRSKAESGKKA